MPAFKDRETGAVVELHGKAAAAAVQSGQYIPMDGESLTVEMSGGQAAVPLSDLGGMAGNSYYQGVGGVANPAQAEYDQYQALKAQRFEEQYGGVGGQVRAGVEGVASGLTLGGYDVLADAAGADTANYAKANPGTHLVGELGGIVAASVATGGGAGASRLGMLLAKTPAGALSKATAKLGTNIGGLKGLAAAQSIEGAGYALGQTSSQMLITDEPLSAEAVWAELGKNAAFGAGAGLAGAGLVHGAGKLAKGWSNIKASRAAAPVVDFSSEQGRAVAKSMADAVTELDDTANSLLRVADDAALPVPEPAPVAAAVDEAVPPSVVDDVVAPPAPPSLADQFAEQQALGQQAMDMAVLRADPKLKSHINRVRAQFRHARDAVAKGSPSAEAKFAKYRDSVAGLNREMGLLDEAVEATPVAPAAPEFNPRQFDRMSWSAKEVAEQQVTRTGPEWEAFEAEGNVLRQSARDEQAWIDPMKANVTPEAKQAIDVYKGEWFQDINSALREKRAGAKATMYDGETGVDVDDIVAKIDKAIAANSTPEDVLLFRGVSRPRVAGQAIAGKALKEIPTGTLLDPDAAFGSGSLNIDVAATFALTNASRSPTRGGGVILEVRLPKGSKVAPLGGVEDELLVPRGQAYRTVGPIRRVATTEGEVSVLPVELADAGVVVKPAAPARTADDPAKTEAIREYHVRRKSYQINDKVRKGTALTDEEQEILSGVEAALADPKAQLAADTRLYRGVRNNVPLPKVGDVLTDKAPAFTTLDDSLGGTFRTAADDLDADTPEIKRGFLLEIDAAAGSRGLTLNDFQKSVLLPRNTPLHVTAVDPKTRIVHARLGGPEPQTVRPNELQPLDDIAGDMQAALAPPAIAASPLHSELRTAQRAAYKALGITDGKLTAARISTLVHEAPATLAPKLAALDEYLNIARKTATDANDLAALSRFDAAGKMMADAASEATGGAGSKLGEVVTALGIYEAGDTIGGPVGDIAKVAAGARLAGGRGARGARGFIARTVRGVGRNMAGRISSKILPGGGGAGSMAAYGIGANAFSGLFNTIAGQRAIAGLTGNTVTRIGTAFGALGKPAGVALQTGQNSTSLIRDARFGYGETADKPTRKTTREAFKDRADELAIYAASPMAAQQAVHAELAEVRKVAPYVADELEMLATAVPAFLYEKLPKDPGTMMRMGQSTWRPSEHDIRVWGEYVKGALAPVDTFEDAMKGRITPQAAEAVRTLFPNLYGQMQQQLAERAPELRKSLNMGQRVRLSILFDVPLDTTMTPEFRGFIADQNAIRAEKAQVAQQSRKAGGGSSNSAPSELTGAQQLLK